MRCHSALLAILSRENVECSEGAEQHISCGVFESRLFVMIHLAVALQMASSVVQSTMFATPKQPSYTANIIILTANQILARSSNSPVNAALFW